MVIMTVLMLVAFLCLVPLRISVAFRLDFTKKRLYVQAALWWIPIFKETFAVEGRYLVCKGTVDVNLDLTTINGKSGINLAKAVVLDSVNITTAIDYTKIGVAALPTVEAVMAAATGLACAFSNCRVRANNRFSLENSVFGEVVASTTLAEILLALLKEKIKYKKRV